MKAVAASPSLLEASCRACGATIVVAPSQRTSRCLYCDSPAVVDRPATTDRPDPVFAIGFVLTEAEATARIRSWLTGRRMTPFGLKKRIADRVGAVYLAAYLYSATADSRFRTLVFEKRPSAGGVGGYEQRPIEGTHSCSVADVVVAASRGIPNRVFEQIEPFDLRGLQRYSPGLVAGWKSEEPLMSRDECLRRGRAESLRRVAEKVRRFMPGDMCQSIQRWTDFRDESLELTLLPVWIFAFRVGPNRLPVRIFVNGQTGRIVGTTPFSWAKLGLMLGSAFVAVYLLVFLLHLLAGAGP